MQNKLLQSCRGKKLISIHKIKTDPYNDQDVGGYILTFSNGIELEVYDEGYEFYKGDIKK